MTDPAHTSLISPERGHRFAQHCLEFAGASREEARIVADVLIDADLRGAISHGLARLGRYVNGLREGTIARCVEPEVVVDLPALALIDAHNGLGQPAGVFAMNLAMDKAERVGIGLVGVRHTNHFGIAGYYARMATTRDMVGVATSNASPQVAPHQGREAMYGTNPIAIAAPTDQARPFALDMATSIAPRGRLERRLWEGQALPLGWALDPKGKPAEDLRETIAGLKTGAGHALLPLGGADAITGGHKGYGLGLLVDLLCGPLTGSAWGREVYGRDGADLGQLFAALRVDGLRSLAEFRRDAQRLMSSVRASSPVRADEPVRIPGDRSAATAQQRARRGLIYPAPVLDELQRIGQQCQTTL